MLSARKNLGARIRAATGFCRIVVCFALIIFITQSIGSARHNHGITEQASDCVSCYFAGNFPSDIPSPSIDVLPTLTIVSYWIAAIVVYSYVAQLSYLVPHSQAPPPQSISS